MRNENFQAKVDELFGADKEEVWDKDWSDSRLREELEKKKEQRLREARQILDAVLTYGSAEDAYKLSFIFQHGDVPDDYLKAHELAKRAMELGHPNAPKMVANSYDRWMTHTTTPRRQKYGTQSHWVEEEQKYVLYPVDPAVTDEERAVYQVPPLAELLKHAANSRK